MYKTYELLIQFKTIGTQLLLSITDLKLAISKPLLLNIEQEINTMKGSNLLFSKWCEGFNVLRILKIDILSI